MKVYETKRLIDVLDEAKREYDFNDIYLQVNTVFQTSLTYGAPVAVDDIRKQTDFFKKVIVKEYQEQLTTIMELASWYDVSSIEAKGNKLYISVKMIG